VGEACEGVLVGAAEGVDRLVVVADDAEVGGGGWVVGEEVGEQDDGGGVDVLELIDDGVSELAAQDVAGEVVAGEQVDGEGDEFVEADVAQACLLGAEGGDGVGGLGEELALGELAEGLGGGLAFEVACGLVDEGAGVVDGDGGVAHGCGLGDDGRGGGVGALAHRQAHEVVVRDDLAGEAVECGCVGQAEVGGEFEAVGEAPGDEAPEAVVGVDVDKAGLGGVLVAAEGEQIGEALAHLGGGLDGEGEGGDGGGVDVALDDHVREAVDDEFGLAGAGAGEDGQWAGVVEDGLALRVVEARQEVHG